ncbi:hypothetical protein [Clostridium sp. YIM B02555]|uniref:hypothetical protein n=1 Tax=Clostridium sp. YIM B02555 TaxID=2911968 RepID=UPI001EEF1D86|nr:hypothetical protein [Clostridium sp. YIM B02555]
MTDKEKEIKLLIRQLKSDYPTFYLKIKIAISISFLIPIIIWCIYFIGHWFPLLPDYIKAGEFLSFYGSVLAFIGTISLGLLALWQNIKSNNINKRISAIENRRLIFDFQPFVLVTDWKIEQVYINNMEKDNSVMYIQIGQVNPSDSVVSCLKLKFINTSNTYTLVSFKKGNSTKDDGSNIIQWTNSTTNKHNNKLYLNVGDSKGIIFYFSKDEIKDILQKKINIELILENRFGDRYQESFELYILSSLSVENNWHVNMSPQKYKIGRFDKKTKELITELEND